MGICIDCCRPCRSTKCGQPHARRAERVRAGVAGRVPAVAVGWTGDRVFSDPALARAVPAGAVHTAAGAGLGPVANAVATRAVGT